MAKPELVVERTAPPPFGYTVGSLIKHQIEVFAPYPWRLEASRLPGSGFVSDWLEIYRLDWHQNSKAGGNHYTIEITYQIFPLLQSPTQLTIPELSLTFIDSKQQEYSYRLPPWDFAATPLIPNQLIDHSPQPLWQPRPKDLRPHWHRLGMLGGATLLALTLLAWHQRWLAWQRTPFRRALSKIKSAIGAEDPRGAFKAFHQALNETAGYALFPDRLNRFLRQHPGFMPLALELEQFFQASQKLFFQDQESSEFLDRLENLCRACIRAEKQCRKSD
ncbi:MAG TPA: hypothetical protein ENI90_02100 [Methylothermaceae bacterium]|nr:hypothetical protein [Methylothermaceae bacterium]